MVGTSTGFFLGLETISDEFYEIEHSAAYLLVDEIFIIILDAKFPFHVFNFGTLLEDLLFDDEHLFPGQFALSHKGNQFSRIFQIGRAHV